MILSRTKLFVVIAAITGVFSFAPQIAHAGNTPQTCNDGYMLLNKERYKAAVNTLTRCLNKRSLTAKSRAISYFNRGLAYYLLGQGILEQEKDNVEWEKADSFFEKALKDAENSIKIDPSSAADAYCLRGQIWLELSWGEVGYDDLEKGKAMGASDDRCQP
ncbi:MAG: hypothetical protein COA85_10300 [Robiginitomaculum sp.]|nr:MAG: hypothetical protein COA85_10300 [Robiginitomaculum sp.]